MCWGMGLQGVSEGMAMSSSNVLQEYWTDQKSAVVVTAAPAVIDQILMELNLPEERPVSVSDTRFALAFWGEDLSAYVTWRANSCGRHTGTDKHTKADGAG